MNAAQPTPTPSLRRRVTATVLGLFALLLVLVAVLVDVALGAQLHRDLELRLADRVDRAAQLAYDGVSGPVLVELLQGQDIRVRLVEPDGASYGDPGVTASAGGPTGAGAAPRGTGPGGAPAGSGPGTSGPGGSGPVVGRAPRPGGRTPPAGPPTPPDSSSTTVSRTLPDGSRLVLVGDTTAISDVRNRLRLAMTLAAVAALLVAAVALVAGVGAALRPLDRLTVLARRITAGDRGSRLSPDRPRSELGRAATAFDGMLDALEDAETRARVAAADARRATQVTRGFLSDAAHELRTPLAGMQVLAESIATGADSDERQQRRARLLVAETGRATRLLSDMLDLARIEDGVALHRGDVDLAALVSAQVERVRVIAPGSEVAVHGPSALWVHADADRVGQILTNLLDNARRHTSANGHITVTVSTSPAPVVAVVTVANTGPSIPDADRERIFGRLVRLQEARDRDSGGAGLGLPVARGLARAHGGDLTCDPVPTGAAFRLTLPLP